jgi:hypothetical protein
LVHGVGILYLLALVFILVQSEDNARQFLTFFYPDLGKPPAANDLIYASGNHHLASPLLLVRLHLRSATSPSILNRALASTRLPDLHSRAGEPLCTCDLCVARHLHRYTHSCTRRLVSTFYADTRGSLSLECAPWPTAAHTFGWWAKMVMLRDWRLCWILGILWELLEYSFQHILPNFHECWWGT